MAHVVSALRVKFGKIEYFITYMPVNDIVARATFPRDLEGWEDMSIEEKFQREIKLNRVRKDIAPYFATDDTRFSGALVLAIQNHESVEFEPLGNLHDEIPILYRTAAKDMGFLIFSGEEKLIPLDGQHRIKAFEFATNGKDDNEKPILGVKANNELGKDQVAVILIRFEQRIARRIFNKINRYARPTSKADNLITDDDDSMAVITRGLIGGDRGVIPSKLVRISGNTLSGSATEFTTLNTLYEANKLLFPILCAAGQGTPSNMTPEQIETHLDEMREEWSQMFSNIEHWVDALKDPEHSGDQTRREIRDQTLLGKPIGQLSLVGGYVRRLQDDDKVDRKTLFRRINAIDWSVDNKMWENVLMNKTGRVMAGRTTVANASKFIAYLLGAELDENARRELSGKIYGDLDKNLPEPVANIRSRSR